MVNEAFFSVAGYVATSPKTGYTRDGQKMASMRVGWTPRRLDRTTGEWVDQPSSFISVQCFRKLAEYAGVCLHRGDPIVLRGTLRVREYPDQAGVKRNSVDVVADSIGHDLSRGVTIFSRPATRLEPMAMEGELAMAGAGRDPLPGDRTQPAAPDGAAAEGAARGDLSGDASAEQPDSVSAVGAGEPLADHLDEQDFDPSETESVGAGLAAAPLEDEAEAVPALV